MSMIPFALADSILLIILLLYVVKGYINGMFKEIVPTLAWILGFFAAIHYSYKMAAAYQGSALDHQQVLLACQICFLLLSLIIGFVLNLAVKVTFIGIDPSHSQRSIGACFGLIKGLMFALFLMHAVEGAGFHRAVYWRASYLFKISKPVLDAIDHYAGHAHDSRD